MPGTVGGTLSTTQVGADNSKVQGTTTTGTATPATTTDKGGFTTIQAATAGEGLIYMTAARMGGVNGMRFVGGTSTSNAFWDFTQTTPIFAFRKYWAFGAAPAANAVLDRFFPTSAHATANSLSFQLGTDRKLQLLEAGTTSLSIGATALPAATHLCSLGLIYGATGDSNAGKVIVRHYPRGSRTLLLEQTATMAAPLTISSWRMGIGNANSLAQKDINDMTAWGYGDWLDRPDLADLVFDPPLDAGGQFVYTGTQKVTVVSGYTGPKTYALSGAITAATQGSPDFIQAVSAGIDADINGIVTSAT